MTLGKKISYFLMGFMVLFGLRFAYGHWAHPNGEIIQSYYARQSIASTFELSRKNYAGQKAKGGGAAPSAVDQRYEKIAALGLTSNAFDSDEAQVRQIAKMAKALIQHEQAYGLDGQRMLQLALGVSPDQFETVIESLREIGKQVSFQVNKVDKTNEYRELLARQESLRKSRDNLIALKSREAGLRDLMGLETQILDLESQIQNLGVSVGEFDSEFEFVTIKMTMQEVPAPSKRFIAFPKRALVAFEWAVKFYGSLCFALAFFAAAAALAGWARAKFKD